jgi:hypothetical protein
LKKVDVRIHGATKKAISYQCIKCDYYSFDPVSSQQVIDELRSPLRIQQKIIKLSQDRLGIYLNQNIVRSLGLKKGENIMLSVPDAKRIVIELEREQ